MHCSGVKPLERFSAPPASSTLELSQPSTLTLHLTGLRNCEGVICTALFASPDGYPNDPSKAIQSGCFPIEQVPLTLTFAVPFGKYAVTVHHDENMDAQLNCNALGIPKEGIGFSGNPRIWQGIPSFQRTAFEFTSDNAIVSITMKYLLR